MNIGSMSQEFPGQPPARRLGRLFADATNPEAVEEVATPVEVVQPQPAAPAPGSRTIQWKGKTVNVGGGTVAAPGAPVQNAAAPAVNGTAPNGTTPATPDHVGNILNGIDTLGGGLEEIYSLLVGLSERESTNERVF
ncbi:MAG TPA: hypothetical protein VF719_02360, partial [Abditibacteriaceae bacterium]